MANDNPGGDSASENTGPGEMTSDERMWGMLCHISALAGFIVPFGNIIGPVIVWMMKKEEYPFVDDQGKESLNFQITITIATVVAGLSVFILIGLLLLPAVIIVSLVYTIMAGVKANEGEWYRYPLTIRFIQ